jgi:hypothetical protein
MHENLNELTPLERRHVSSPLPVQLVDAAVLLMRPTDDVVLSLTAFIAPELGWPVALPASPVKLIPKRAVAHARVVHETHVPLGTGHSHWGLKE